MELSYRSEKILQLLSDFYLLTHFRVAIFKSDFQELLAYPTRLSSLCKAIRSDESLLEACRFCDFNGFNRCKHSKSPIIYQCHMGLTEMIVPIYSNQTIIGYFMCGQIRTSATPVSIDKFLDKKKETFTVSSEIIQSTQRFLEIMAFHIEKSGCLTENKDSLSYEIDQYILSNLSNPLDVTMLCEKFHYKKTAFYKTTGELYGIGIMKHIQYLRIQKAKEYLSTTDYSVSQIALKVGIADYNYFTKVFKSIEHCTPREYRKNNIAMLIHELQ